MSQADALSLLEAYDISAARWGRAENSGEAAMLADAIGYPVTMKIESPDIIHKSDVGGVQLKLENRQQLEKAFTSMYVEINQKQPGARLDGVIIQEHLFGGIELLLGCKRDQVFGPVLVFGAGGVFAEIINDISLRILPLSREEARSMIEETKVSKMLAGARGAKAVDMELLINFLVIFSELVLANPDISEMDLNPLLVYEDHLLALDARVILS